MDCYLYVFNNIREKLRKNFAIFYQLGLSYQCQFFLFEITLFLKQDLPLSIFFITNFFHIQVTKVIWCFFKRITCKFSSFSCLYLPIFQISISNLAILHNGIQNSLFMKVNWLPLIYFFSRIRFPNDVYHGIIHKVCQNLRAFTSVVDGD